METINNNNNLKWNITEESNLQNDSYQDYINQSTVNQSITGQPIKGKEIILFKFPVIQWENVILENEKELIHFFYKLKEQDSSGVKKSNDGGWQSNMIQYYPPVVSIIKAIEFAIFSHFKTSGVVRDLWVNISGKGHSNTIHSHNYGGTFPKNISGVYYFQVPNQDSALHFYRPGELNLRETIIPKPRDLLLFPIDFFHSVDANTSDQDRISVAFNFDCYAPTPS